MTWLDNYLARLRSQHPGYVLVIVEGGRFSVYDQDADVMHRILNWNEFTYQGHRKSGCPTEHYALPKDGYCHLWEKRNVTDDDYPERRTDE